MIRVVRRRRFYWWLYITHYSYYLWGVSCSSAAIIEHPACRIAAPPFWSTMPTRFLIYPFLDDCGVWRLLKLLALIPLSVSSPIITITGKGRTVLRFREDDALPSSPSSLLYAVRVNTRGLYYTRSVSCSSLDDRLDHTFHPFV